LLVVELAALGSPAIAGVNASRMYNALASGPVATRRDLIRPIVHDTEVTKLAAIVGRSAVPAWRPVDVA
jgi:hypothetical protein